MSTTSQLGLSRASYKELTQILSLLDATANGLRSFLAKGCLPSAMPPLIERLPAVPLRKSNTTKFDRGRWGQMVAVSLAPKFDSQEFSRAYRAALSSDDLRIMDAVRLKKVLQQLCETGAIQMISGGRGPRPAQYRVLSKKRT